MNLLLFLSALLAGLTGVISGDQRTDALAVQQSVARTAEVAAEAVAQQPLAARHLQTGGQRPILSTLDAKALWALTANVPATDIAHRFGRLLI